MLGRLEFQKYQKEPYVVSSTAANSCQRPSSFLITVEVLVGWTPALPRYFRPCGFPPRKKKKDTNFTTDQNQLHSDSFKKHNATIKIYDAIDLQIG